MPAVFTLSYRTYSCWVGADVFGYTHHDSKIGKEQGDYSTVTDFARLRGWSISVPRSLAIV